jgi:nucleoside-diphosphate-sugar epimerase
LTGHVGGAIARALVRNGHEVKAVVRHPDTVPSLMSSGLSLHRADLNNDADYERLLDGCDAAVHAAYEYSDGREVPRMDMAVVDTVLRALDQGRLGRFVYTSNALLLANLHARSVADEAFIPDADFLRRFPRLAIERLVTIHPRAAAVRVGMVYGGGRGTIAQLFRELHSRVDLSPVAQWRNRWSLVYLADLADLYVRIVESSATGVFHGTDGLPLPAREVLARCRTVVAPSKPRFSARLGDSSSAIARAPILQSDVAVVPKRSLTLGWTPRYSSFRFGVHHAYAEWLEVNIAPCRPPPI